MPSISSLAGEKAWRGGAALLPGRRTETAQQRAAWWQLLPAMAGADQRWRDDPSREAERYLEAVTAELKGVDARSGLGTVCAKAVGRR